MDVDAFAALRSQRWQRLSELVRLRTTTGSESDELVALYQSTASDYSRVQTHAPDPTLVNRLSTLLNRSRLKIAGAHEFAWADVSRFFVISLPAAFYRVRWWTLGMMVAFIAIGFAIAWWTLSNPEVLAQLGTPSERRLYAEDAFAAYYSNYSGQDFTLIVWTNNAWIAVRAVGLGITGIGPIYLLVVNAIGVGQAGAILAEHGMTDVFFGLILPHGQLELTAIFIACGAGLKLFWTAVVPGAQTRARALASEGRSLITVALGLVIVLFISGVVEGFVPRQDWPAVVKIGIGTMTLIGYWAYTIILGRQAVRDGETGDMRSELREDTVASAN